MNPQIEDTVAKVDEAFLYIFGFSAAVLLAITVVMVYFLIRYHRSRNPEPADIEGSITLETLWTVIPTLIVLLMFWFGWQSYKSLRGAPEDAMQVSVEGRMWSWSFEYENGKTSSHLVVPQNQPVKLNITSTDVIHSFYVPAYRIKIDAVPGMDTYAWFNPKNIGEFDILCAEYCGVRHAFMLAKVKVVPPDEFQTWVADKGSKDKGDMQTAQKLYEKYGCLDCHSTDGTVLVGPSFKDIAGREVEVVTEDGQTKTVTADEEYLRRAIYDPDAELVKGFDNMMPPYKDDMPEEDLQIMVNDLLGKEEPAQEQSLADRGREIVENEGCIGCHSTDGTILAAPSFKGIMGRQTTLVRGGETHTIEADVRYIISAIKSPNAEIVQGYDPIMPAYDHLSDAEVKAVVEYLSTLK